jgi:basic amino acid/polyamine antiporter, APA family
MKCAPLLYPILLYLFAMASQHKLNLFSLTMIVVSLVIGMGIFKNPALVAAKSGTESIFFYAWLIGGLVALCGAFTYAEIGVRLPVVGAYYKVFAHCYHPAVGFTVNAIILISNAASLAIVALIGSDYISDLLFNGPSGTLFNASIAIIAVALFYGVNLLGLKTSSGVQNFLTLLKIGLILLLISALFTGARVEPHGYSADPVYVYTGNNGLLLLIISLIPVCFAYGGYQQTINFGGEVKKTATLYKGIAMGIFIVVFLYLAINYTYVQIIGFDKMKNANAIGALLCEAWFGGLGAKVFDVCMFLSVLAYVNVLLMSNPRVMYAMSEDKVFPAAFSYKNPRTDVLTWGLTAFAAITIVIIFFGKGVDNILGFTMFLDSIGMSTSAATLLILRRRKQGQENVTGPASKITPLLCVLFVLAYAAVALAVIIDKPMAALTGAGLLLFFLILYFVFYHKRAHQGPSGSAAM